MSSRTKKTPEATDSRGGRDHSPEARLWRCVIHRALLDAFAKGGTQLRETAQARK